MRFVLLLLPHFSPLESRSIRTDPVADMAESEEKEKTIADPNVLALYVKAGDIVNGKSKNSLEGEHTAHVGLLLLMMINVDVVCDEYLCGRWINNMTCFQPFLLSSQMS